MEELLAYRSALLSALKGVIDELSKMVTHRPPDFWLQPTKSGLHTPHYYLFRLCALEAQVFTLQLPRLLAEDHPVLPVFDEAAWMSAYYQPAEPFSAILEKFVELRHPELVWLGKLTSEGWSRLARHPWWGEHSLQWWVELQVDCSYQHLNRMTPISGM